MRLVAEVGTEAVGKAKYAAVRLGTFDSQA